MLCQLFPFPTPQDYDTSRVTLSRTFLRSDLPTKTVGSTQVYTLAIDLTQLDCDTAPEKTKACGAGRWVCSLHLPTLLAASECADD